jgi:hypothetical protein
MIGGLLLWAASAPAEPLRRPAEGTVERREASGNVEIRLPFGTVTLPEPPRGAPPASPPVGKRLAHTRAHFRLRYRLARAGNTVRAKRVRVSVDQTEEFLQSPTDKLREHERVHQRINDRAAMDIQRRLSTFRVSTRDLAQAETDFKALFRREVQEVDQLHRDWDENHTFPAPTP